MTVTKPALNDAVIMQANCSLFLGQGDKLTCSINSNRIGLYIVCELYCTLIS
jgi:hypothetical protein